MLYLNERKIQILEAIINDYIYTAEPIGSRTIAKKYNLGISSATIRNEMSDLEEMGLIIQPHASSGRVPSDKGYRLYVDKLMRKRELTSSELEYLQKIIYSNLDQIDFLMQETAKAISVLTNYTTIATSLPSTKITKIRHTQLMPLDERTILLVLVTEGGVVKNINIKVNKVPDDNDLNKLSGILNKNLKNCGIDSISIDILNNLYIESGQHNELIKKVITCIIETLSTKDKSNVYLSGAKNILEFPEFNDVKKAKDILQTFEEDEILFTLIGDDSGESIQIIIGDENKIIEMKNCSIIKTNLKLGDDNLGTIGILGPTRMDYSQAASILFGIARSLDKALKALTGG